jgi:hypothetical protein
MYMLGPWVACTIRKPFLLGKDTRIWGGRVGLVAVKF